MKQPATYTMIFDAGAVYLLIGTLLATALFFLTIYFGLNKKQAYLFFASYALLGAVSLLLLERNHVFFFLIAFTLACLSLLYFFLTFFSAPHSKVIAILSPGLLLLTVAGFGFYDGRSETVSLFLAWLIYALTLMACSWIALRAVTGKKYGGKLLFLTTALIFVFNFLLISDSFFVSSISMASCMFILAVTYTVLHDIRNQNELVKTLKFRAMHLENEMLKKSIQPHFLLNTLTVLSEWIEEQPALAVQQIELLSREFRYITRVSGETLIPIGEEMKICQVHLDMFNAKQASHFTLETRGLKAATNIPPMVFHTLIENGLTHSNAHKGRFLIEERETTHETHFRVTAEPLTKQTDDGEGLGLAYIKSRLEQAFPGRWRITSEAHQNAWETLITISK